MDRTTPTFDSPEYKEFIEFLKTVLDTSNIVDADWGDLCTYGASEITLTIKIKC